LDYKSAIYHYCNYQERCHKEVRNKLYELGCKTPEVEELIAELIEKDLLNEERYARAYARGKFRMKNWGKQKIIYQLKQNHISEYCIRKAMEEINTDEYNNIIYKIAEAKLKEYSKDNLWSKKNKLYKFLLQKGYESLQIKDVINKLLIDKDA
jgi:regulatory protein